MTLTWESSLKPGGAGGPIEGLEAADPWTFSLDEATQARVAFHVPYVGYVLSALAIRQVRMVLIGLPALLIAFAVLVGFSRDVRKAATAPETRP